MRCLNCNKPMTGKSNKKWCSPTCKTAAARSRKETAKEGKKRRLSQGQKKDMQIIMEYQPIAGEMLNKLLALYGLKPFKLALEACYFMLPDDFATDEA